MDSNQPTFELPKPPISKPIQFPKFIKRLVPVCLTLLLFLGIFGYFNLNKTSTLPTPSNQTQESDLPTVLQADDSLFNTKLNIESTSSGVIKTNVTFHNKSNIPLGEVYYKVILRQPFYVSNSNLEKVLADPELITQGLPIYYKISDKFQLLANSNKEVQIEIPYSSKTLPGNYILEVFLTSKQNPSFSGAVEQINLKGSNQLLQFDQITCQVIVNGQEYNQYTAPLVNPRQSATARCTITNPTSSEIVAKPIFNYSQRSVLDFIGSEKLHQASDTQITFAPNETKVVEIALPALELPQVYESFLSFVDSNNQPLSPFNYFRWTVAGASAYISKVQLDKSIYQKGEVAKVSLTAAPSMDLFWRQQSPSDGTDLISPKLIVKLSSAGGVCGQIEKTLPPKKDFSLWKEELSIQINSDCINPKIEAQFQENNSTIANFSDQVLSIIDTKNSIKNKLTTNIFVLAAIAFISVVLILLLLVIIKRKKS